MKTLIRSAAMLTAALTVGLMPLTSVKGEPRPNPNGQIDFTFVFEAPPEGELTGTLEGFFTADGPFNDSGRATENYTLIPVSPTLISANGMKILEGRRGTMVMTFQAQLQPQANGTLGGQAQWTLVAGSGAYKKIRGSGQGQVSMVIPPDGAPYLTAQYSGLTCKDTSAK